MQIHITRNINSDLAETEEIPALTQGQIIEDVEAVNLCRLSPELRSLQIRKDGAPPSFILVPADAMTIVEDGHWQGYARRIEENIKANKPHAGEGYYTWDNAA
jgi:hypothetical protein